MREITEITIQNFQSHTLTKIKPAQCGNLTALVGASNCGKTAVLRALRWLFYNIPQGTDYIRIGASSAKVTVTYNDGISVTRERGKSFNRYIITRNGQEQVFEGFGVNVPLEVQEITGVKPIQIADFTLNLNMAEQLDGPFLGKSISAGARAKVLGKLAGTEELDLANKTLGTDIFRRSQDVKRLNSEVSALEESIKQFDWLPAVAERIGQVEKLLAKVKQAEELKQKLFTLQYQIGKVEQEIEQANEMLRKWRMLTTLELIFAKVEAKTKTQADLVKASKALEICHMGIAAAEKVLARKDALEKAEQQLKRSEINCKTTSSLAQSAVKLRNCETQLEQAKRIASRRPMLEQGETIVAKLLLDAIKLTELRNKKLQYQKVLQQLNEANEVLARFRNLPEAEKIVSRLHDSSSIYQRLGHLAGEKDKCEAWISLANGFLQEKKEEVERLLSEYQERLTEAGICPLCGSEINPEKIKEVI